MAIALDGRGRVLAAGATRLEPLDLDMIVVRLTGEGIFADGFDPKP